MKEGQKNYRTTPTRAKGRPKGLAEKNRKIGKSPYQLNLERELTAVNSDETPRTTCRRKPGEVSYEGPTYCAISQLVQYDHPYYGQQALSPIGRQKRGF
ncbi:hypothetical protein V6N12_075853 [Hibiscus sabdariffa]|uniref:Uncharacterized protein n=1 Tax=Hibiscus sabdariffa TaxID=183260 RepID=A0ABR2BF38_9ROSI